MPSPRPCHHRLRSQYRNPRERLKVEFEELREERQEDKGAGMQIRFMGKVLRTEESTRTMGGGGDRGKHGICTVLHDAYGDCLRPWRRNIEIEDMSHSAPLQDLRLAPTGAGPGCGQCLTAALCEQRGPGNSRVKRRRKQPRDGLHFSSGTGKREVGSPRDG